MEIRAVQRVDASVACKIIYFSLVCFLPFLNRLNMFTEKEQKHLYRISNKYILL